MVRIAAEDERLALAAPGALEIGDRILRDRGRCGAGQQGQRKSE
jgi:hypothetical protein